MTTGPQDPAAAGRDRLRASHADREQAIDTLKDAFVYGRLAKDELEARTAQALAARTHADLAALTADIPPGPPGGGPARVPAPARRGPLARAAVASGTCLLISAAAIGAGLLFPPDSGPGGAWADVLIILVVSGIFSALCIMGCAVFAAWDQRLSSGQLPPRPGPGGHAPEGERRRGTGQDPVPPGPRIDQTRADLRARKPRRPPSGLVLRTF
ncbi:MAG TPA: DUF1707 domain-containing protein [Streptosporangiaceae bacterium]